MVVERVVESWVKRQVAGMAAVRRRILAKYVSLRSDGRSEVPVPPRPTGRLPVVNAGFAEGHPRALPDPQILRPAERAAFPARRCREQVERWSGGRPLPGHRQLRDVLPVELDGHIVIWATVRDALPKEAGTDAVIRHLVAAGFCHESRGHVCGFPS